MEYRKLKTMNIDLMEVIRFASEKHRFQHRKDGMTPYINHPIQVAHLLSSHGETDPVLLAAALLHDTIEDTDATAEDLKTKFGEEVLALVLEVTDDKTLSRAERKRLQIEHAKHSSHRAKLLKLADKICNISDIMDCPPDGWRDERKVQYLKWSVAVVKNIRGVNADLEALFDKKIRSGSMLFSHTLELEGSLELD